MLCELVLAQEQVPVLCDLNNEASSFKKISLDSTDSLKIIGLFVCLFVNQTSPQCLYHFILKPIKCKGN